MTKELIETHQLTSEELCSLQYYVSDKLTLVLKDAGKSRKVYRGRLLVRQDNEIGRVIVRRGLRGVAEEAGQAAQAQDTMRICFDPSDDKAWLEFEATSVAEKAKLGTLYCVKLLEPIGGRAKASRADTKRWYRSEPDKSSVPEAEKLQRAGTVIFAGRKYAVGPAARGAYLLIEKRQLRELIEGRRVLPGKRVSR